MKIEKVFQFFTDPFVREISILVFYAKYIWPLHRLTLKSYLKNRCLNCIISEVASPLSDGLCSQCTELLQNQAKNIDPSLLSRSENLSNGSFLKNELCIEFDKKISQSLRSSSRTQRKYDAMILFSGGKDSHYLIHRLKTTYPEMRLLLLTVDNTFMSPIALKNVHESVKKLNLDHLIFRPKASLFEKMYRHAFLNINQKGCSGTVDQFDGDIIHDIGRNLAAEMNVPFLLSGLSPVQVEKILGIFHFQSSGQLEETKRLSVAGINLENIFSSEELCYWWNPDKFNLEQRPQVLFPFYAWGYDEKQIKEEMEILNWLPASSNNPLLTNNLLIPLMGIVDIIKFGYISFEPEFCELVRSGKADKVFWRSIFEITEYAAKSGKLVNASLDSVLNRLNLNRKDLGIL